MLHGTLPGCGATERAGALPVQRASTHLLEMHDAGLCGQQRLRCVAPQVNVLRLRVGQLDVGLLLAPPGSLRRLLQLGDVRLDGLLVWLASRRHLEAAVR